MCRIKELRKRFGMTQEEMLTKFNARFNTNYSAPTLSLIENGKRIPDFKTMGMFADFFSVSLDYLCGRADDENKDFCPIHDGSNGLWTIDIKQDVKLYEIAKWYHEMPEERQRELHSYAQYLFGKDTVRKELEESRRLREQLAQIAKTLKGNDSPLGGGNCP